MFHKYEIVKRHGRFFLIKKWYIDKICLFFDLSYHVSLVDITDTKCDYCLDYNDIWKQKHCSSKNYWEVFGVYLKLIGG